MYTTFRKDFFITGNGKYFKIPVIKNFFDELAKKHPILRSLTIRKEEDTTYLFIPNSGKCSDEELALNLWTSCGDLKAICKTTAIAF